MFYFGSRALDCCTFSCKHKHDQIVKAWAERTSQFFSSSMWCLNATLIRAFRIYIYYGQGKTFNLFVCNAPHLFFVHFISLFLCFNYGLKVSSFDHQYLYFISISVFNQLITVLEFGRAFCLS